MEPTPFDAAGELYCRSVVQSAKTDADYTSCTFNWCKSSLFAGGSDPLWGLSSRREPNDTSTPPILHCEY